MATHEVAARNYPTKKSFIEAVKAGRNITFTTPSRSLVTLRDFVHTPQLFTVTTPLRGWFAEVVIKAGGKVVVK